MLQFFRKKRKSLADIFHHIYYKTDWWKATGTGSGPGSTLAHTENIRAQLPALLQSIQADSLLDAPCGDLNWMCHVDLGAIQYTGVDIVEKLIRDNQQKFPDKLFMVANIIEDDLPAADVVLCRDCFIHLSNNMIVSAIQNFKRCGIKYLLTNTYHFIEENKDIDPGGFRMINMELPPFSLSKPLTEIEEEYTSGYPDKQLALWEL